MQLAKLNGELIPVIFTLPLRVFIIWEEEKAVRFMSFFSYILMVALMGTPN